MGNDNSSQYQGNESFNPEPSGEIGDSEPTALTVKHPNGDSERGTIFPGPDDVTVTVGSGIERCVVTVDREWWDGAGDRYNTEQERVRAALQRALVDAENKSPETDS